MDHSKNNITNEKLLQKNREDDFNRTTLQQDNKGENNIVREVSRFMDDDIKLSGPKISECIEMEEVEDTDTVEGPGVSRLAVQEPVHKAVHVTYSRIATMGRIHFLSNNYISSLALGFLCQLQFDFLISKPAYVSNLTYIRFYFLFPHFLVFSLQSSPYIAIK